MSKADREWLNADERRLGGAIGFFRKSMSKSGYTLLSSSPPHIAILFQYLTILVSTSGSNYTAQYLDRCEASTSLCRRELQPEAKLQRARFAILRPDN